MTDLSRCLTRVTLQNYKSIGWCDVDVGSLVILVGPNGVGKSNLLDALRFVGGALRGSLAGVVQERGGLQEILHRGTTAARGLDVVLEFRLSTGEGFYGFELERSGDGYAVAREVCHVDADDNSWRFAVTEGEDEEGPKATTRRLCRATSRQNGPDRAFRCRVRASIGVAFCNPKVDRIRDLQPELGGWPERSACRR